jgi:hypothetical protein
MKNKKKFTSLVIGCVVMIPFSSLNVSAIFTGTASDPFPIRTLVVLQRTVECIRVHKNWSNNKHFSLQTSLKLETQISLAPDGDPEHQFNGYFHGNGHTIAMTQGGSFFGYIGKSGVVEDLTIAGNGDFASQSHGTIKYCTSTAESTYGITDFNNGSIQNCKLNGKYGSYGIASSNCGKITNCVVLGSIYGHTVAGLVDTNQGTITNCRVKAHIKYTGNGLGAGLTIQNNHKIENCTMNGSLEGLETVYLIYGFKGKDAVARRCVAGKSAKGATDERLFGEPGENEQCGYEDWDQIDYCTI